MPGLLTELGALHSEPILAQLTAEGPGRLTAAMRALADAALRD
jgi:hypothetical protein